MGSDIAMNAPDGAEWPDRGEPRHAAKGTGEADDMHVMGAVLLGIPDDDAKNREHAGHLGIELVAPELPAGSVPGQCAHCDGALRLDPQSGQIRHQLTRAGHEPPVVCLTCAHSLGMLGKTDIGAAGTLARFKEKLLDRKGMPLMTVTEDDTTTGAGEHANQRPGNGKREKLMREDISFGEWLHAARVARGWSVKELAVQIRDAAKANMSDHGPPRVETLEVLIGRWEQGKTAISGRWLPLVKQVLADEEASDGA